MAAPNEHRKLKPVSDSNLGKTEGATSYTADTTGHVMTVDELAPHSHTEHGEVWANVSGKNYFTPTTSDANWINTETAGKRAALTTGITGGGKAHAHRFVASTVQPSLHLNYLVKI